MSDGTPPGSAPASTAGTGTPTPAPGSGTTTTQAETVANTAIVATPTIPADWVPPMTVTPPDPLKYRMLTVEQIQLISQGADDQSLNICLAFGGMAAGFFQNICDLVAAFVANKPPTLRDLGLAGLCILFAGIAVAKLTEWRRNKPRHREMVQRIIEGSPRPPTQST
jgi:hypothetical protein